MPRVRRLRTFPANLRRLRRGVRYNAMARFYVIYVTLLGKTKRASWVVRISSRLTNRRIYQLMVATCNNILDNRIPQHYRGQVFSSFNELLNRTTWVRVRRIKRYKPGVIYER